jgi:D-glycero-D-manno-heptose 1,7-bisphosphate phosphatase
MKRPAVFFDRDNTLLACDEYLGDPDKVVPIPGAAEAVARARRMGYATVVISNQSGVARGDFGEDAVRAVNARMDELLRRENPDAIVDRHEFCPYHPDASIERYRRANSPLRKPAPGMLYSAAEAMDLDLKRSWLVGDAPRDIEAGHAAGCRTILFTDPSLKSSPAALVERRGEPG